MLTQRGNTYNIYLKDGFGNLVDIFTHFFSFDYNRSINNVGKFELRLPISKFHFIQPYFILEVWRNAGGGVTSMYLDTETVWIIVSYGIYLDDNGELYVGVTALDANMILSGPGKIVAYFASSSQSSKTGLTGNLMKAVVSENVASTASDMLASTGRGLPSTIFSIQANLGDGASISMSFSYRTVLSVLQDMANASTTAGIYMAFDVVSDGLGHLEFRTYANQRGVDHRLTGSSPIILDPTVGNLAGTSLVFDYTNEATFVYAAGQGTDAARTIATSSNSTRMAASPFARREVFVDARQSATTAQVQDAADAALRTGRGVTTFDSKIIENPSTRYGIEYKFGDILTCQLFGQAVDCRLDKVHVSVAGGQETIDVRLQSVN
jgi:hypothetical protein